MDNLVNYGSDEDNGDSDTSSKYHQGMLGARRMHQSPHGGSGGDHAKAHHQQQGGADDGTNYEQVQMDLSEEDEPSSKNALGQKSPEKERDRAYRAQNRNTSHNDKRDRDNRNSRDSKDRDHRDRRDDDRDKDRERDRDRNSNKDNNSSRDRSSNRGGRDDRRDSRDSRGADRDKKGNSSDRDRDNNTRRDSRDTARDNRRDRDRNTSTNNNNRDRDNYSNRDNRDNRQRDNRRRSPGNQQNFHNYRGGAAGRRFDRASNKMAQLEKLGIEIKAPDNFVPPASGIYTPDDARGNNLGNSGLGGNQAGGANAADGQFFMPGVTGRFRDQIERRKQLWAKSKQPSDQGAPTPTPTVNLQKQQQPQQQQPPHPDGSATWAATTFAQDTDGRQASKFKRLMGIRGNEAGGANSEGVSTNKRQEEMFNSMEAQYEVARTATHTMRGVGLGFGSGAQGLFPR